MPGVLPDEDEEEGREPDAELPAAPEAPPVPGGDLGAAVAAALQAALERTGVVPPSPLPPGPPPAPASNEPLDLLDTSSAPWLTDPELGVQWAESWIGSQSHVEPEPGLEPVPEPESLPEAELAATPDAERRPEPAPEPVPQPVTEAPLPPVAQAPPIVQESAVVEPASPPAPPPPVTRPYQPRSLEIFAGHTAPAAEPVTWSHRATAVPEPVPAPAPVRVAAPSTPSRATTRTHWMTATMIGVVLGLLAGLVAYAVGPAVTDVYLTRYDVPVAKLPPALEGLRVVQVGDLHLPGSAATADSAARLVVRARPDIVLITGDMVDDAAPATLAALDRFLTMTRGARGTFAILGERETALRARLEGVYAAKGVRLLTDERSSVDIGNARLVVAGFDGSPAQRLQLTPADARGLPEALRPRAMIVMTHAPELLRGIPRADLQNAAFVVAGHTLGGLLGLPSSFGAASRYRSGWYTLDATHLYVSNGIGTGRLAARLLAPAEVTRFTLRRAKDPYQTPTPEMPDE